MSSSREFDEKKEKSGDDSVRDERPLDSDVRADLEGRLGRDLGRARVHIGPEAQMSAREQGARAITRDHDVYFAPGEYDPGSEEGRRLLAHELVHSLQQETSGPATASREALEAEADQVAASVTRDQPARVHLSAAPGQAQRQEEKKKPETPTIRRHPGQISPLPPEGTVAGGGFAIPYAYSVVKEGDFVPLVLQLPEGVSVVVTPVTGLKEGTDYRVQNAGGSKARPMVVSVSRHMKGVPKLQLTLSRGSASYIVVFQFPGGTEKAEEE